MIKYVKIMFLIFTMNFPEISVFKNPVYEYFKLCLIVLAQILKYDKNVKFEKFLVK